MCIDSERELSWTSSYLI